MDRAILLREVSFYALALALLLLTLSDRRPVDYDDEYMHIFISFGNAALLVGAYVAYVCVCAYYDSILAFIGVDTQCACINTSPLHCSAENWKEEGREPIVVPEMPFLRQLKREPSSNFGGEFGLDSNSSGEEQAAVTQLFPGSPASSTGITDENAPVSNLEAPTPFYFLVDTKTPRPSKIHGLEEIMRTEVRIVVFSHFHVPPMTVL